VTLLASSRFSNQRRYARVPTVRISGTHAYQRVKALTRMA
jgi:hypothetical protein